MDEWWHPRAHRHGPHGPSRWPKEDGIMTSIAEEDENSEILDMERHGICIQLIVRSPTMTIYDHWIPPKNNQLYITGGLPTVFFGHRHFV